LAEEKIIQTSRFAGAVFLVQVCRVPWIFGWRSGTYLLRVSGNTVLSYQGEDL
jgi:hypothetical protein